MTRPRTIGFIAAALLLTGAAAAQETEPRVNPKKQAQVYESALQGLIGQAFGKVISAIDDWKLEALVAWEAENPDAKEVGKHNRAKIKFSKKEAESIFGGGGKFKVVVYRKLVGTDRTTIGTVDGSGMGAGKDSVIDVNKYAVVRVVFKDDALCHFRVWPSMEESGMSGGMNYRGSGTIR